MVLHNSKSDLPLDVCNLSIFINFKLMTMKDLENQNVYQMQFAQILEWWLFQLEPLGSSNNSKIWVLQSEQFGKGLLPGNMLAHHNFFEDNYAGGLAYNILEVWGLPRWAQPSRAE